MDQDEGVSIAYHPDVENVLTVLGIPFRPEVEAERWAALRVEMDPITDGRLENLLNRLAELRWKYEPGRTIQLELTGVNNGIG